MTTTLTSLALVTIAPCSRSRGRRPWLLDFSLTYGPGFGLSGREGIALRNS